MQGRSQSGAKSIRFNSTHIDQIIAAEARRCTLADASITAPRTEEASGFKTALKTVRYVPIPSRVRGAPAGYAAAPS
jgi:hypothetical protein